MTQKPPTSAAAEEIVRYMQKVWAKDDGSPLDKSCTFTKEEFCHVVVSIRKLEAQQTDALRQRIDNAHADIYSVWNGGKLSAVDLNHLESALAILGHIIDELKSPRGGDTLSELRTQIEALIDKALADYIAGINKTMHVPGYSATVEIIKGIKGEALKLIDSAEARKR